MTDIKSNISKSGKLKEMLDKLNKLLDKLINKVINRLGKHGLTKMDLYSMSTFVLMCLTLFSLLLFKLPYYWISMILSIIGNVLLFEIGMYSFKQERERLEQKHFSVTLKQKVPQVSFIISYVLFSIMIIASVILHIRFHINSHWIFIVNIIRLIFSYVFLIFTYMFIASVYIFIFIYLISTLLPYNYDAKFKKNKIGNFLNTFSAINFSTYQVINLIFDDRKLKYFLNPLYVKSDEEINSKRIINNLKKVKSGNLRAYLKLKATIQSRKDSHFWNILSVSVGLSSIFITLYSKRFFNDLINGFTNQSNSTNEFKAVFEITIGMIFIIVIIILMKYADNEMNKIFYREWLMYFDEAEK